APPRGDGATSAGLPPMRPLPSGAAAAGTLQDGDPRLEDGSLYDLYFFAAQAGQAVTVEMRSPAFDAYLSWGRMNGGKFEELGWDDNGAGGTDARLSVTAPAGGVYVVRANARRAGQTGPYTLALTPSADADARGETDAKPGGGS
ncbi:MAG: peptidase, partial [Gemmatimonadetes bacterium]|nr:peptidase [Gemmatimonadota bacterium]